MATEFTGKLKKISPEEEEAFRQRHRERSVFGDFRVPESTKEAVSTAGTGLMEDLRGVGKLNPFTVGSSLVSRGTQLAADLYAQGDKASSTPQGPGYDASTYETQKPGVFDQQATEAMVTQAVPDSTEDPGSAVKAITTNRLNGVGTRSGMPQLPEVPTPAQVANDGSVEEGKQIMFRELVEPNWYEDDSFAAGMMSFGLNMLAGNDIATSFNQGATVYERNKAKDKRKQWAQDLLAQGFDAHEVEAWIQSGDNKALTDPFEKKARQQALELQNQQLIASRRENDPAWIKYQQDLQRQGIAFSQGIQLQQLGLSQQTADLAAQKHALEMKKLQAEIDAKTAEKTDKVQGRDAMLAVTQMTADKSLANRRIGTTAGLAGDALVGLFGEKAGQRLAMSGMSDDVAEARKTENAQSQYTEGAVRYATGAVVKNEEQQRFQNYFFPQGEEWNDERIVARKLATQDVFDAVARNVAMGKSKAMDPAMAMQVAKAVSEGSAVVLKDPATGLAIGLRYSNGMIQPLQ